MKHLINSTKLIMAIFLIGTFQVNAGKLKNLDHKKGIISLKSGDYTVDISTECKYTISSIKYKNYDINPLSGYTGSVMRFKDGTFLGTGHREGGEEKILSVELFADDKKVDMNNNSTITAKLFKLKKSAMLGNILVQSEILISPEGIRDTRSIEAKENQELSFFYLFMYCFPSTTTKWIAKLANDKDLSGDFKNDNKFILKEDIKWSAQYDPKAKIGILVDYSDSTFGDGSKSRFWDKQRYHKYYLFLNLPRQVAKGYKLENKSLFLKAFEADPETWQKTAAENLQKK